jgi:hypothetical protein
VFQARNTKSERPHALVLGDVNYSYNDALKYRCYYGDSDGSPQQGCATGRIGKTGNGAIA